MIILFILCLLCLLFRIDEDSIKGHNYNGCVTPFVRFGRTSRYFFSQHTVVQYHTSTNKLRKSCPKKNCANYYILHNTSKTILFSTAYYIPNTAPTYFFKIHYWTKIQCWSRTLYTILWNTTTNTLIFRSNTYLRELLFTP